MVGGARAFFLFFLDFCELGVFFFFVLCRFFFLFRPAFCVFASFEGGQEGQEFLRFFPLRSCSVSFQCNSFSLSSSCTSEKGGRKKEGRFLCLPFVFFGSFSRSAGATAAAADVSFPFFSLASLCLKISALFSNPVLSSSRAMLALQRRRERQKNKLADP